MTNLAKLNLEILTNPKGRPYVGKTDQEVVDFLTKDRFADIVAAYGSEVLPIAVEALTVQEITVLQRIIKDNNGDVTLESDNIRKGLKARFGGSDEEAENKYVFLVRAWTSIAKETGIGTDVTATDVATVRGA